ncbi:hypothetical protein OBO34_22355 [Clostridiales Family XIII bacterium ASD5510]|uniref:Uncharacterized protein n=1 Tax=Hominibacterium faecale TaxID=2839743 RepID=A0A9J6R056_9FIRM|nr:hypothetical protein [Hominibacterium faecale]MCU7381061.1 hypothetical protein [Hominibacterium faecale]
MNGIEKLNKGLQDIFNWIAARNKVLWQGAAGEGNTITVPGLQNYKTISINTQYGNFMCCPDNGIISGLHADRASPGTNLMTHQVYGTISGDKITLIVCHYMEHVPGSGHGNKVPLQLVKIIGVEPIPAKILSGGAL